MTAIKHVPDTSPRKRPNERTDAPVTPDRDEHTLVHTPLGMTSGWWARAPEVTAGMLLIVALVLGGGLKGGGDAVVHAVAVPALGLALLRWRFLNLGMLQHTMMWVLIGAVGVAVFQLIPIPSEFFTRLPQRALVLSELQSAGFDPSWLPMTLDRWGTWRALIALLSFLAMWMLCTTLSLEARIQLLKLAVLVAVPMALLGFAQASIKRDTTGATALFANRNHFATLMAMLLPVAFAAARQALILRKTAGGIAWYAATVIMLLAAAMSFSRVGTLLACFAALAAMAVSGRPKSRDFASRSAAVLAMAVAAAAVGYFAYDRLGERFQSSVTGDLRWQYFQNGWHVLQAYWPWGGGLGSFRWIYAPFEPLQSMGEFTYANYAHNDLLQSGIEAGLPGLTAIAVFLGVLTSAFAAICRRGGDGGDWPRAAAIAVLVVLLHSLVDYPLRTLACSILLALVLSVLFDRSAEVPPNRDGRQKSQAQRRPLQ